MGQVIELYTKSNPYRIDAKGYDLVPERTIKQLEDYVFRHRSPGGFLTAVLCNDLQMAVTLADAENLQALKQICQLVYNRIPGHCWGCIDVVESYLKTKE